MAKTYYITTAIDYVNARPHIGHATEKIQADVLARFHRGQGEQVYFLGGTDEFSLKNVQAADLAEKNVREYVDENARAFKKTWDLLGVSFDDFIRTTEDRHVKGAQKFWSLFDEKDLYKKKYSGLYCVGCEEFKMEKDLVDGRCPEHTNTELEQIEEENWFFKLSKYQKQLEELIENDGIRIVPKHRKNEVLAFIRTGLEDFSVSRSMVRARDWGVPVPGDEGQVMYVWVDALSNYITGLDFASDGKLYETFWGGDGEKMHVIGKGILRFHAVYWPAMLLSAGLPTPTTVYAHEYLSINGKKISKSLGNVINPEEVVQRLGKDGARYALLSALPYRSDGDISWKTMIEKYNADLVNGLGNLVSRVVTLGQDRRSQYGTRPMKNEFPEEFSELLREARIFDALEYVWKGVRDANKYVDETRPWDLKKSDMEKFDEVMQELFRRLYDAAFLLEPFLPETSDRMKQMLDSGEKGILFKRLGF